MRHIRSVFRCLLLCTIACAFSVTLFARQKYQQDDIDRGAALYGANCAVCHASGNGVAGVNLATGQFRHATSDDDLVAIIHNGIPGTAMPAHPEFAGTELIALVSYLRNMRDYGAKPVQVGDAAKGKS